MSARYFGYMYIDYVQFNKYVAWNSNCGDKVRLEMCELVNPVIDGKIYI